MSRSKLRAGQCSAIPEMEHFSPWCALSLNRPLVTLATLAWTVTVWRDGDSVTLRVVPECHILGTL